MNIDLYRKPRGQGLNQQADPEVWVRVQSDELLDLPGVMEHLTLEQKGLLRWGGVAPLAYHPALVEGGDGNPYRYEDWWIFEARV